jgi:hypothetical protein
MNSGTANDWRDQSLDHMRRAVLLEEQFAKHLNTHREMIDHLQFAGADITQVNEETQKKEAARQSFESRCTSAYNASRFCALMSNLMTRPFPTRFTSRPEIPNREQMKGLANLAAAKADPTKATRAPSYTEAARQPSLQLSELSRGQCEDILASQWPTIMKRINACDPGELPAPLQKALKDPPLTKWPFFIAASGVIDAHRDDWIVSGESEVGPDQSSNHHHEPVAHTGPGPSRRSSGSQYYPSDPSYDAYSPYTTSYQSAPRNRHTRRSSPRRATKPK